MTTRKTLEADRHAYPPTECLDSGGLTPQQIGEVAIEAAKLIRDEEIKRLIVEAMAKLRSQVVMW